MKQAIRYMAMNNIYDSNEVPKEKWVEVLPEKDFNNIKDNLNDLSIWIPDISIADLKNNWNGSLLCGGGMNECLKEIQLLMSAFNIKYKLVNDFIY